MKTRKILPLALILFTLSGCGNKIANKYAAGSVNGAVANALADAGLVGTWNGKTYPGTQLIISPNGAFSNSGCAQQGTILTITPDPLSTCPWGPQSCGNAVLNITASSGAGTCLPVGAVSCYYYVISGILGIDCHNGEIDQYEK